MKRNRNAKGSLRKHSLSLAALTTHGVRRCHRILAHDAGSSNAIRGHPALHVGRIQYLPNADSGTHHLLAHRNSPLWLRDAARDRSGCGYGVNPARPLTCELNRGSTRNSKLFLTSRRPGLSIAPPREWRPFLARPDHLPLPDHREARWRRHGGGL